MSARIIYLDQNKWIDLARSAASSGDAFTPVVEFVRAAKSAGAAVFPLSMAHYIESNKQRNEAKYEKLGRFMFEIAGTKRIASPLNILRHEIEIALSRELQRTLALSAFTLLGDGVAHASGIADAKVRVPNPNLLFTDDEHAALSEAVNAAFEEGVLTGRSPFPDLPFNRVRPDLTKHGQQFRDELDDFRRRLQTRDKDLQQRAVYANALVSILPELNAACAKHGIPVDLFERLGADGITRLLMDLPSMRVNIHLRQHWIANPSLRSKPTDMNDWYYLGAAVAHCDVVVAEKHFTHLVNTGSLRKRATVITDLRDLPGV